LGQYFPEDAPEDQDARSIEFLGRFLPVLERHGAEIQNLDCTVFARDAKIAPVADEMRRNIADQLGLEPYVHHSVYANNLGDEGDDRVRSAYGQNFEPLAAVKQTYDPTNFFRLNQNIRPHR